MSEEWRDADELVDEQEAIEDDALTRAAEHGEAEGRGVVAQDGDAALAGSEEAAAWTPGHTEPSGSGQRSRPPGEEPPS
jgi:hypothetical protein